MRRLSLRAFALAASLFLAGTTPAVAVERALKILAPAKAVSGEHVRVSIRARTDAGGGEHIGFLHIDYSENGGETWKAFTYNQDLGATETCNHSFVTGPAGSRFLIRAKAAFRGGSSGDVDYRGQPIDWHGSWTRWDDPPARLVEILVE
jgi:hypothetical protein